MVFSRRQNIRVPININGSNIERVKKFTYLGLHIDENLKFETHILHVTRKVNQVNGILNSLKYFLPTFILRKIYFSLIHCHLNLHVLIWSGSYSSYLKPLHISINKSIRNICRQPISTLEKFKTLNIPTPKHTYLLKLAVFMYSSIKLKINPIINFTFDQLSASHSYNTRNILELRPPLIRTDVNLHFYVTKGLKLWALLPDETKNSSSEFAFKKSVKQFLMNDNIIL